MYEYIFPFQNKDLSNILPNNDTNTKYDFDSLLKLNFNSLRTERVDIVANDDPEDYMESVTHFSIPDSNYVFDNDVNREILSKYLTIMNWNVRSVSKNFKNFQTMFCPEIDNRCDIIGLCETRLSEPISHLYDLDGHTAFHLYRNRLGGGVSIYIRNNLNPVLIPTLTFRTASMEIISTCFTLAEEQHDLSIS